MQTLRDWKPGDRVFEAAHHQEGVLADRELQQEVSGLGARVDTFNQWKPGQRRLGKIVNKGPKNEDDYTDCKYFIQWVIPAGTLPDEKPTTFVNDTTDSSSDAHAGVSPGEATYDIVTAINLAEWVVTGGTHTLPVNGTEYVVVAGFWDAGLAPEGNGDGSAEDAAFTLHWFFDRTPARLFPVTVTMTSGSAGSQVAAPSYVYTVTALNGVQLGLSMSPTWARAVGRVTAAANGVGYFNTSGTFVLYQVDEVPGGAACA